MPVEVLGSKVTVLGGGFRVQRLRYRVEGLGFEGYGLGLGLGCA